MTLRNGAKDAKFFCLSCQFLRLDECTTTYYQVLSRGGCARKVWTYRAGVMGAVSAGR